MESIFHALPEALTQLTRLFDGNTGLAIIALSITVRLVLLPLTYRSARHQHQQQRRLHAIKPQLDAIRERHRDDPVQMVQATRRLHREHGIALMSGKNLLTSLVQAPIVIALYTTIRHGAVHARRFLWMRSLGRPDLLLAFIVAALTGLAMLLNPALPEQVRTVLHFLPVLITFVVVWHLSAGLGLYWASSNTVSVIQALMLRRHAARMAATIPCG